MQFPNLVGPSNPASSWIADNERTVNLVPTPVEAQGSKPPFPYFLDPTPGFTAFASLGQGPVRQLFSFDGRLWAVGGNTLYEVMGDSTVTTIGTVTLGGVPQFACNGKLGDQLLIASGNDAYVFNTSTSAFSKVLTGTAATVVFVDDFFVALDTGNNQFQVSALLDGTTWPGAGVASRSVQADPWQAMIVSHRLLWLIGQTTGEVWYNAGNDADQPFALDQSGVLQFGIAAPASLIEFDNAPVWLAQTKDGIAGVMRFEGYQPKKISSLALDREMRGYATVADAYAYTMQDEGHLYYILSFPTANKTWVFDAVTQLWHERGFWYPPLNDYQTYRPCCHAVAFGKHLVGDRLSGNIYSVTPASRTSQTDTPTIMARLSKDGGRTWGYERWESAGNIGQYRTRVMWDRWGMTRDGVWEVAMTDTSALDLDGSGIRRLRRTPHINNEKKRVVIHSLELDLDVGMYGSKWVQAFIDAEPTAN